MQSGKKGEKRGVIGNKNMRVKTRCEKTGKDKWRRRQRWEIRKSLRVEIKRGEKTETKI